MADYVDGYYHDGLPIGAGIGGGGRLFTLGLVWPGCRPVPTTASAFAWRCSTVASMNKGRSR